MATKPRILFLDIETAPNKAYVWGLFNQNISHEHVESSGYVLCWSAQWYGEREIVYSSNQHQSSKRMLAGIYRLLNQADIVVHFNGLKFDIPTLNKEFVQYGYKPPAPYKQLDIYRVCKYTFRFESNKLDAILKTFKIGEKVRHQGFSLWVGCMNGDAGCWNKMRRYNQHDVRSLVRLYQHILPWIEKHPVVSFARGTKPACPNCGGERVQKRGVMVAISKLYTRFHCQGCGKWFKGPLVKPAKPK